MSISVAVVASREVKNRIELAAYKDCGDGLKLWEVPGVQSVSQGPMFSQSASTKFVAKANCLCVVADLSQAGEALKQAQAAVRLYRSTEHSHAQIMFVGYSPTGAVDYLESWQALADRYAAKLVAIDRLNPDLFESAVRTLAPDMSVEELSPLSKFVAGL